MIEIEKMFENAGFNKREIENCTYKNSTPCGHSCDDGEDCPYLEIKIDYPPFTAEKQIELIKWLSSKYGIYIVDKYSIGFGECIGDFCIKENFEEALAESINHLWQDLTDQEKEEIRRILNER